MNVFSQAIRDAMKAGRQRRGDGGRFPVGVRVEVTNRDYRGEHAEVVGYETNMLGLTLVVVRMVASGNENVFYPGEVRAVSEGD